MATDLADLSIPRADLARASWRATPAGYALRLSGGEWEMAHHHALVSLEITRAAMTGGRTIINMPPRHGKSELTSHWTPTWYLDMFPSRRVFVAGYGAEFATEWGRKVRDTIEANPDLLRVRVRRDSRAVSRFNTTAGGAMYAVGLNGTITGRGAHLFIIDDPHKNYQEAHSAEIRQKLWDNYLSGVRTRIMPGGAVVVIMTRWHEDDFTGRLVESGRKEGEEWRVVRIPAVCEAPKDRIDAEFEAMIEDYLARHPGDALWPEQYDEDELDKLRSTLGPYLWLGMYQQRPSSPAGTILKRQWWKRFRQRPALIDFDEIIQSWDTSFDDTESADYVVGQVWGRIDARYYLLDQVRDRMDFPEFKVALKTLSTRWPDAGVKLIEKSANGPAVIKEMRATIPGLIPVEAEGSKTSRVHAVSGFVEAGNVWVPTEELAPFSADFVDECANFPTGVNDDQVDAFTQAVLRFNDDARRMMSGGQVRDDRAAGRR